MTTPTPSRDALAGNFRLVSLLTLVSRILGMVRDVAMAALFGAGPIMDAFSVAFRIPNLARALFGEGALTSAFLPIFVHERHSSADSAAELATAVFALLGGLLLALVSVAELALLTALWLAQPAPETRLLLELIAVMTPYVICICLAAQLGAILHSLQQFTWPALLPVVLNLLWLLAVAAAAVLIDAPLAQVRFIAACLVAAGVVQLACALRAVERAGFRFSPRWRAALPRAREVFRAIAPILLGLSIAQVSSLLDSFMAWGFSPSAEWGVRNAELSDSSSALRAPHSALRRLPVLVEPGTASALYFGQRMYQFPLGVFGVALGTVLFPLLSAHAARGDLERLRADLAYGLRLTLGIGIPAGAGLMVLARPITALLFQHGRFTADDAAVTARMVAAYSAAVWAYMTLLLVHRTFYAIGDRLTPVRIGLVTVAVNVALTAATLQVVLATVCLQQRIGYLHWREIAPTLLRALLATAVMAAASFAALQLCPADHTLASRLIATAVPLAAGVIVFFCVARSLGLHEPWDLLADLARRSNV
jgi:putative peptidoglycan lipid II flippase